MLPLDQHFKAERTPAPRVKQIAAALAFLAIATSHAADKKSARKSEPAKQQGNAESVPLPDYPRVDLAPRYEVVKGWPERPKDLERAAVPSIALDREGNIWIHTRANPMVQVYAPDGKYLRGWKEEDARAVPHGIAFDADGNVWLVDVGLHNVRKFTPEGKLLLTLGVTGEAATDDRHFNRPTGIAFAPNGDIFIADGYGNSRVVHLDREGRYKNAWGTLGVEPGNFSIPHAIAIDSKGLIYVADRNNVRIQVFNADGKLLDVWSNLITPWGFFMTPQDELWVCGSSPMGWSVDPKYPTAPLGCPPKDQMLAKFNTSGKMLELHSFAKGDDAHERPGDLNWFHAVALDQAGNIFVGDIIGKRVQKFARKDR
jgi:hypothetical protein